MNIASPKAFAIMFSELLRWDAKFFSSRLKGRFPFARLGPLVRERSERHNLFEFPEKIFRILGVNNTGGVFHAYDTPGSRINQPYKHVEAGDFFYNPYRVNVGSIGLVPPELGGNFASPAYVVFSVDHKVIVPEILGLILKSRWYNNTLRSATAGSVRQNLTFDLLQMLEVPLPPIETQQLILAQWRKAQAEIEAAQDKTKTIEAEIKERFFAGLGLKMPAKVKPSKCFVARWRDFLRWSVSYHQATLSGADILKGKFPVVEIGSILELVQYGTSEKANNKGSGIPVVRMNNIKNGVLDMTDMKHIELPEKERQKLILQKGDILFNRTNSKELVGKCAVFHEQGEYVFASYLIRVRAIPEQAIPDFVSFALNSLIGRKQIDAMSRQIIGQANINSQELRTLQMPLPPLAVQRRIMEQVEAGRARVAHERETAQETAFRIETDLEAWLLGTKKI